MKKSKKPNDIVFAPEEFTRLVNNFYVSKGMDQEIRRVSVDAEMFNYVLSRISEVKNKKKIAFCCICLNENYWPFAKPMIEGAKSYFLPGHQTDFFLWSDMPEADGKAIGATIFPTEPDIWPMPTLMRYHLMLQQEEKLKEYDYIFYCDIDMLFVSIVGDEILGEGLTAVQQPMYALRKEFWPPYEPNPESASYIPRPGRVIIDEGKPRFMPLYFAGGFQGGKTDKWIEAMRVMKIMVDKDFNKNYVPIWNDETVWNTYLFKNPDEKNIALTPSYTYPDTLVKEYFIPMWGRDYFPKLVTLTKKFSLSKEGGDHVAKTTQELASLK